MGIFVYTEDQSMQVTVILKIPIELRVKIKTYAAANGITMKELIIQAVEKMMEEGWR
jgi:hypothetical protein